MPTFNVTLNFWTTNFFSDPKVFWTLNFYLPTIFFGNKIFLRNNFFGHKFFCTQIIFLSKNFGGATFLDPNFLGPNIFLSTIAFRPKFFEDPKFLPDPKILFDLKLIFFDSKYFLAKNIFDPKFFPTQKCFGPKIFFRLKFFLKSFQAEHFWLMSCFKYFTALLALYFNSLTPSLQSVSMSSWCHTKNFIFRSSWLNWIFSSMTPCN